jgi:hypothetical protein
VAATPLRHREIISFGRYPVPAETFRVFRGF